MFDVHSENDSQGRAMMIYRSVLVCGAAFTDQKRMRLRSQWNCIFVTDYLGIASLDITTRMTIGVLACRGRHQIDGAIYELLPKLGLVATFGVGFDDIDIGEAAARGIRVTNTPDVLNDDVADLAVALMLSCSRDVVACDEFVRSGNWAGGGKRPLGRRMSGKIAGICGLGRIGREVANRLEAFKMNIHYHSRSQKQTPNWTYHEDVVGLAKAVDFLVIALSGGKETHHYVTRSALENLGPRGILINISRGTTVDESALLEALETGAIAGAGLDVFCNEPEVNPRFFMLENVVLQPHQASSTTESREAMADLQCANIDAYLKGRKLLTPVN